MPTAKEVQRAMFDAVNRRDLDAMRALLHDDYVYMGGDGQEQHGPDAGIAIAEMYLGAFPDARPEMVHQYAPGDEVAIAELRVTGTHNGELMGIAPTGRRVELPFCNVVEVKDGKIWREREYIDSGAMLTQLGVIEEPGA